MYKHDSSIICHIVPSPWTVLNFYVQCEFESLVIYQCYYYNYYYKIEGGMAALYWVTHWLSTMQLVGLKPSPV